MTDDAALDDGFVLINVWSQFLGVAVKTDRVSRGVSAKLPGAERPVWVVAVVALDQALIHAVPKR